MLTAFKAVLKDYVTPPGKVRGAIVIGRTVVLPLPHWVCGVAL